MAKPFRSAGRSDIGKVRRRNEDAILVRDDAGLWAVADGLGGHSDGDYASQLIVERLAALSRKGDVFDFIESIDDALVAVNADLRSAAQARAADLIASTVVLLVYDRRFTFCGWVGDSRAYRHVDGSLAQMTRDHLYGNEDEADRWSGGPAQPQPGNGVLSRAVGADTAVFVDWAVAGSSPGTQFVLCSDGLNKEVSDAEIDAACGRHASPASVLDELFKLTLDRGARDNVSAIVVRVQDGAGSLPHLDETNRALRALDAAFHAGELDRDSYRQRRRDLFETAVADAGTTAANPRTTGATMTRAPPSGWLARARALLRLD